MTTTIKLQSYIDEIKERLPNDVYVNLCSKTKEVYEEKNISVPVRIYYSSPVVVKACSKDTLEEVSDSDSDSDDDSDNFSPSKIIYSYGEKKIVVVSDEFYEKYKDIKDVKFNDTLTTVCKIGKQRHVSFKISKNVTITAALPRIFEKLERIVK